MEMYSPHVTEYPEVNEETSYPWQGSNQTLDYSQIDPTLREEYSYTPEPQVPIINDERPEAEADVESDFLDNSQDDGSGSAGEISDADSDTVAYRKGIDKWKDSVRKFRAEQRRVSDDEEELDKDAVLYEAASGIVKGRGSRGRARGRGRGRVRKGEPRPRGRKRGSGNPADRVPREPPQPTGEIKLRLHQANNAFLDQRFEDAKAMIFEIIRINAETFEAWVLLSEIWRELGDMNNFVTCRMYAAHLRPNHVDIWLGTAKTILEDTGMRHKFLQSADFCYTRAIAANPKNCVAARLAKAEVLKEWGGKSRRALDQYQRVLKVQPHDLEVMRLAAELYLDLDTPQPAIDMYKEAIEHFRSLPNAKDKFLDWTHINVFVELQAYAEHYSEAIASLKFLTRWLLGRDDETYWDNIVDDDREFDNEDGRRLSIPEFEQGRYTNEQYGPSLPLELRTKLGSFRLKLGHILEALLHLNMLDVKNAIESGMIQDYPDLYRDAADDLLDAGLYSEAIPFYTVLQSQTDEDLAGIHLALGRCHLGLSRTKDAEDCFESVLLHDAENTEARMQLAKICERANNQEKAFIYVNEVMNIQRKNMPQGPVRTRKHGIDKSAAGAKSTARTGGLGRKTATAAELRAMQEEAKAKDLQQRYVVLQATQSGVEAGDAESFTAWMQAAKPLVDDFRSFRPFYPWDKYIGFKGYRKMDSETGATTLDGDVVAMADRLAGQLNKDKDNPRETQAKELPTNYRGILFAKWLDIFLQYAIGLCKTRDFQESYAICEAARDCIIWYHDKETLFLINITHCTCALLDNDEARCLQVCRFFTARYQFNTDAYRLFSAMAKLHKAPTQWYSASPTQKYIQRQIKAMDAALASKTSKSASCPEAETSDKAARCTQEDVNLLVLYGHILAAGSSHTYALNYFFRAYALDPTNPLINLTIGLSYIQYALKRQSENRQYHIMQGTHFLFRYYDMRILSPHTEERQEAHYVMGRAYHLLGLTHLAHPYYKRCLEEARREGCGREEIVRDVALNLQGMYMMSGNALLARSITEEWLVI